MILPSIISGKPVNSLISIAFTPPLRRDFRVPPVDIISTGPDREQTIIRQNHFS